MAEISIKINDFYNKNKRSEINYVVKAMERFDLIEFRSWQYVPSKDGYYGVEMAATFKWKGQEERKLFEEYFNKNILLESLPDSILIYIKLNDMEYESSWEVWNLGQ
jgi:hypothetical protein